MTPLPPPPDPLNPKKKSVKKKICNLMPLAFLGAFLYMVTIALLQPKLWEKAEFTSGAATLITISGALAQNRD